MTKVFADVAVVSAGHPKHEYTSGTAFESVFAFFADKMEAFLAAPEAADGDDGDEGEGGDGGGDGPEGDGGGDGDEVEDPATASS